MRHSREPKTAAELLHADYYTPKELNELLHIGLDVIRRAAREGALRADMAGHDIVGIRRRDVLDWLERDDYGLGPVEGDEAVP